MFEAKGSYEWDQTAQILKALGDKRRASEINPFRTQRSNRNKVMVSAVEMGRMIEKDTKRR